MLLQIVGHRHGTKFRVPPAYISRTVAQRVKMDPAEGEKLSRDPVVSLPASNSRRSYLHCVSLTLPVSRIKNNSDTASWPFQIWELVD